jgi:hypothetical protein
MLLTRAIKGTSMAGEAPDGPLASRRVLVVEDEFFLADDMAAALRALGAEVVGPEELVRALPDVMGEGRR